MLNYFIQFYIRSAIHYSFILSMVLIIASCSIFVAEHVRLFHLSVQFSLPYRFWRSRSHSFPAERSNTKHKLQIIKKYLNSLQRIQRRQQAVDIIRLIISFKNVKWQVFASLDRKFEVCGKRNWWTHLSKLLQKDKSWVRSWSRGRIRWGWSPPSIPLGPSSSTSK